MIFQGVTLLERTLKSLELWVRFLRFVLQASGRRLFRADIFRTAETRSSVIWSTPAEVCFLGVKEYD